ncbi:MAG TPA: hypothetical protein RMI62_12340, partial [Polyangiaceae bacterium LLY-WYZ-15_(1-7)]|nr:hypothetical protein [Polyangiaceae bacterium LLY-WYZ-15_(1-7)]
MLFTAVSPVRTAITSESAGAPISVSRCSKRRTVATSEAPRDQRAASWLAQVKPKSVSCSSSSMKSELGSPGAPYKSVMVGMFVC